MKSLFNNLRWLYRNSKNHIPIIIIIIICGSAISLLDVSKALVIKYIIDSATISDNSSLKKWIIIFAIVLLSTIFLTILQTLLSNFTSEKFKNNLQKKLYDHIIHTTWLTYNKYHSIEFLTRMTNDVATITSLIVTNIPNIISLIFMFIFSFITIVTISPLMAIISISLFPFLILISKIYGRKLSKFYTVLQKKESIYNKFLQETFNNILIVKTFCLEKSRLNNLSLIQNDKLNISMKKAYFSSISTGFIHLSSLLGYFVTFLWGSFSLFSYGISSFGNLTAMIDLFSNIQVPIYGLSSTLPQIASAFAAIDRLKEIESLTLEETNNFLDEIATTSSATDVNGNFDTNSYTINFKNICFSYDKNNLILNDINLELTSGDTIGIIGPSGGGKTTLIRLLLSLMKPDSGEIFINNRPISIEDRNLISYVPQGNTLFTGTIYENINFSNSNLSKEAIDNVLKMSCSYDFINELPNKINTLLGENGLGISQGQAQRITIARALINNKPILILDEATSSLDKETEVKILNSIESLNPKPICIIITHRIAALSICNKIYKLEDGKLSLQK